MSAHPSTCARPATTGRAPEFPPDFLATDIGRQVAKLDLPQSAPPEIPTREDQP